LKKVITREKCIFCNWFLQAAHDGVLDSKLIFFTIETWFHLSGFISVLRPVGFGAVLIQNKSFEVFVHDTKIGVWCAIATT
jgi:hypothetical protein